MADATSTRAASRRVSTGRFAGALAGLALLGLAQPSPAQPACAEQPLALQVLGSGGPVSLGGRASTSYLVWVDGAARVLVDAGGGSLVRLGESGAEIDDLRLVAVSHLHPDHVAELPALLWHAALVGRRETLAIAGPSASGIFPGLAEFLSLLFDERAGAFRVLSGSLGGPAPGAPLEVTEIDAGRSEALPVLADGSLVVDALAVPHGGTPSLAFRVRAHDRTVVFGSDQTGASPEFPPFSERADVLVMHLAITEDAGASPSGQPFTSVHAPPSRIGQLAQAARVGTLVLGHLFGLPEGHPREADHPLSDLDASLAVVRQHYGGPLVVADDLLCLVVE